MPKGSGKSRKSTRQSSRINVRDTTKLLLFAQAILFCGAGAIPDPFKLAAFLPLVAVLGAGMFWLTAQAVSALERRSHTPARAQAHPDFDADDHVPVRLRDGDGVRWREQAQLLALAHHDRL